METEFHKCISCPTKPDFSDTSHLLTHVSSKGHLSHLHKLQIRSHQEVEAGQLLLAYDVWFQQHGLAELLSERLRQKEARQAAKQAGNKQRAIAATKRQSLTQLDQNVFSNPLGFPSQCVPTAPTPSKDTIRIRRRVMQEEMDDPEYYPTAPIETLFSPSAFTNTSSLYDSSAIYGNYPELHNELSSPAAPDVTKLKGTIWPGMDLFDAATEEMQKKRNQKKDGSVLKHMKAFSASIEPLETTYSPGGTMKRERHLDDLEDEDDLLEGESPVKKSPSKRKRKVYTKAAANGLRGKQCRARAKKGYGNVTDDLGSFSAEIFASSLSSIDAQSCIDSRLPSLESDSLGTNVPEEAYCLDKKPLKQGSNGLTDKIQADSMYHLSDGIPNPFSAANHMFGPSVLDSPLTSATWLLPDPVQHQNHDPSDVYQDMGASAPGDFGFGIKKESLNPLLSLDGQGMTPPGLSMNLDGQGLTPPRFNMNLDGQGLTPPRFIISLEGQGVTPKISINPMFTIDNNLNEVDILMKELNIPPVYPRNPLSSFHTNYDEQYDMADYFG